MRSEQRREQMKRLISDYAVSGQTKKGFCSEHRINPATFYYWQCQLKEEPTAGFEQVNLTLRNKFELRLPGGTCLEVRGEDIEQIAELVRAIDEQYA